MASITKRYGKWQARYTWYDSDGKMHQKSKSGFATKSAAKQYASKLAIQQQSGLLIQKNPTFADWYHTYKEPHISDSTKRHYLFTSNLIKEYFKNAKLKKSLGPNISILLTGMEKNMLRKLLKKFAQLVLHVFTRRCLMV